QPPWLSRNHTSQIPVRQASMVTGFEGVSRMNAFWHTWRREIIRGAVLFFGVIAIGLCVRYVFFRARQGVLDNLPVALSELKGLRNLRDLGANFDPDLNSGPRHAAETWTYRAKLAPKQWLWIRNANGSVRDRKSTRLNSSHGSISYAVFCLKKKK